MSGMLQKLFEVYWRVLNWSVVQKHACIHEVVPIIQDKVHHKQGNSEGK
jgi:hypothetical protein